MGNAMGATYYLWGLAISVFFMEKQAIISFTSALAYMYVTFKAKAIVSQENT